MLYKHGVATRLLLGLTALSGLWCLVVALAPEHRGPELGRLPMALALLAGSGWLTALAWLRDRAEAAHGSHEPGGTPETGRPIGADRHDADPDTRSSEEKMP